MRKVFYVYGVRVQRSECYPGKWVIFDMDGHDLGVGTPSEVWSYLVRLGAS